MSQSQVPEIILYHYTFSPYAQRIVWYLNLRQIPYTQCLQPVYLPRPDMKALGTNYRRIPILSVGRDIYTDTRLMLLKLESLFPASSSHPSITSSSTAGLSKLFSIWSIDGGGFRTAGSLLPPNLPLLNDEKFQKDREDYTGVKWTPETLAKGRPESLVEAANTFEVMENLFLADEKEWIAGKEGPGLVDIEAVWLFIFLQHLPGALPTSFSSRFPAVFAWTKRFEDAAKAAASRAGKPRTVEWNEAREIVKGSGWAEEKVGVDEDDPTGFKRGMVVEVWPIDSGFNHRDRGELVGIDGTEVVVRSQMEDGTEVRVHAPRHGFRVKEVRDGESKM